MNTFWRIFWGRKPYVQPAPRRWCTRCVDWHASDQKCPASTVHVERAAVSIRRD